MILDKNGDTFELNPNEKTVLYIDANNLFFKAYHVANSMDLNPMQVLLNMAYTLKMNLKNDFSFAIFDGENSKDSRLNIYPNYKENRESKDVAEEEKIQNFKNKAIEVFEVLGYTVYHSNGIEADDVIGILALKSAAKKLNVIAVSSDKDYKQLCEFSPYINIYQSLSKECEITHAGNFEKKLEIPLDLYVDYLSLVGDKIDNVIGVKNVGPKTAKKWLNEIGSLTEIVENLDKIKNGTTKNNLIQFINEGRVSLNKRLIEFHFDKSDEVIISKNDIKPNKISIEKLDEFCIKNGFKQFREKNIEPLITMREYIRNDELKNLLTQKNNEFNQKTSNNEENKIVINRNKPPF